MRFVLLVVLAVALPREVAAQVEIPTRPRQQDYYAWITQIVTAPHELLVPANDSTNSRRLRLVVLTSEIYSTAIIEELHFGIEACCARVIAAREIALDSLATHFGLRGERAGFEVVRSLSPSSFRVRFMGREFDISHVNRPRVQVTQVQD